MSEEHRRRPTFWRQAWTLVTSRGVSNRLATVERAIERATHDPYPTEEDADTAATVSELLASIADTPQASVRVGSLLLVKYEGPAGPVMLVHRLSPAQLESLDAFPEILTKPREVFQQLELVTPGDPGDRPTVPE
jgi:hypothetical protein